MRHSFAYTGPEGGPFEIPDAREVAVLRSAPTRPVDEHEVLSMALAEPIGGPSLIDHVGNARRVLLLVDDGTRGTPVDRILPHLEPALQGRDVTILTAQGTHRHMSDGELAAKLGPYARTWRVLQHDWSARDDLEDLGETSGGMPVVVNRALARADVILGVGQVSPHAIMGYSGGAKIVHPGVSGAETETWTHWSANWHATEDLMGVEENPIRREIEEGARMCRLSAVLNVVLDAERRIQHAAYGDVVKAQRECARVSRLLHETPIVEQADVVIADSRPADRDYWQSAKGLYTASIAVKEGGSIVLASPNSEGVADNHPSLLDLAPLPLEEIRARVRAGSVKDVIAAAVAAYTARIRERANVHLVSSGIKLEEARRLGFTPHATLQAAVDAALDEQPRDARVTILHGAGSLFPRVRGRNDHLLSGAGRQDVPA